MFVPPMLAFKSALYQKTSLDSFILFYFIILRLDKVKHLLLFIVQTIYIRLFIGVYNRILYEDTTKYDGKISSCLKKIYIKKLVGQIISVFLNNTSASSFPATVVTMSPVCCRATQSHTHLGTISSQQLTSETCFWTEVPGKNPNMNMEEHANPRKVHQGFDPRPSQCEAVVPTTVQPSSSCFYIFLNERLIIVRLFLLNVQKCHRKLLKLHLSVMQTTQ